MRPVLSLSCELLEIHYKLDRTTRISDIIAVAFGVLHGAIYSHPGSLLLARLDEAAKAWYLYSNGSLHSTLLLEERHLSESPANAKSPAALSHKP
jgi:hypothetical protein